MIKKMGQFSRIVFVVEVYARDLPGRLEIAKALSKPGIEVYVVEQELLRRLPAKFFESALVYDKSIANSKTRYSFYKRITEAGGRVVVEDEEANVVFSDPERYISARTNEDVLELVDYVFCWNEKQRSTLEANYPVHSKKFVNCGSSKYSAFQLHNEQWTSNDSDVLVPSNFSLITNYGSVEDYLEFRRKLEKNTRFDPEKYKLLWTETELEVAKVGELSDSQKLYIRPHPSDNISRLSELFSAWANVSILPAAPLADHLLTHSKLLHFNCNSAIEAQMIGMPIQNIARNAKSYLSDDYKEIVGDNAISKIAEFLSNEFQFRAGDSSKSFDARKYVRLLKFEYVLRKILQRNISKNLNKKNVQFLSQEILSGLGYFVQTGFQKLN